MSINDQKPDEIGRHARWGSTDDQQAPPVREQYGPSMVPVGYGRNRWGRTIGLLYIPAVIALISLEIDVLHIPAPAVWLSLVGLFVAFLLFGRWLDRRQT